MSSAQICAARPMANSEEEGLKHIFPQLVARLQASDIIDQLYQNSLLTDSEYAVFYKDIHQNPDFRHVNRGILMAVKKGQKGSITRFEEILRTSQPDLAQELRRELRATRTTQFQKPRVKFFSDSDVSKKKQQHFDDIPQLSSTLSEPSQPLPSTSDAADPEALPTTNQPKPSIEERVVELEKLLEKAVTCVKELSSHLMEQPSLMKEQSFSLRNHTLCKVEQSLHTVGLSSKTQLQVLQTAPLLQNDLTLQSEKLPDLPIPTACATAVIIDRKVYVCGGRCDNVELGRQVHMFCLNSKTWTILSQPAPQYRCEAIAFNEQLVLIGGREAPGKITNMVSTWTGQRWQQDIPAMHTKRFRPGVIMYDKYVIVAGGMSEHNQVLLNSIDILDTSTLQWWTPANFQLPRPMYALNIAACSSGICVAAAIIGYDVTNNEITPSNDAWQLPIGVLEEVLAKKDTPPEPYQWKKIAPTPNNHSTLVKSSTHPVAVGGSEHGDQSSCNSTCNISVYNPTCDKWSTVGELVESRAHCTVVCIGGSSFLVCGGYSDIRKKPQPCISSVEQLSYHI